MRKVFLCGLLAVTVAACGEVPIDSMTRSGWDAPASMPPAGYTRDTWVDARGCVYFSTATGWVPHIGGNLKQVCR